MQVSAVIIEDERKGLINLKNMLGLHCPEIKVIGEADGIATGTALFATEDFKPDLAFLDINLVDGKIFQLLDAIGDIDFDIIFVTAYDRFAIKACEYASIGYILKPIDPDLLTSAVGRVMARKRSHTKERLDIMRSYQQHPNSFDKLSVPGVDGIHFTNLGNVVRFEAEDNYTHIYLAEGQRITASRTIKHYEELYTPYNFYRVHKRHVINLNYMKRFVKGESAHLIMNDGLKIEVSRRRRPAFMTELRRLQGVM